MSTDSGVSPFPARSEPFGKTGGTRYRDGRVQDRWGRDEEQVRTQLELAQKIAEAIEACAERSPELEPGRTLGPRQVQRLNVAARGYRRLVERDEKILGEFEAYNEAAEHTRAKFELVGGQNGAAA